MRGASTDAEAQQAARHAAVLGEYCVGCHNEQSHSGGLVLDKLDIGNTGKDARAWETVVRKLRSGAMPPPGRPRPDKRAYDSLATYLETTLDRAAARKPNPGRTSLRRLNRAEYANAVRDLLGVHVDGAALLLADATTEGFDNIAEVQSVSPLLVEKYVAAAAKVTRFALGDSRARPVEDTYTVSDLLGQDDRAAEELPFGSRGGLAVHRYFPVDADYIIKVRLKRNVAGLIRGLAEPHVLDLRVDGVRTKSFTIGGESSGKSGPVFTVGPIQKLADPRQNEYEEKADESLTIRVPITTGEHHVQVAFLMDSYEPETIALPRLTRGELERYKGGAPEVQSLAIEGPFDARGVSETSSRRKILSCRPGAKDTEERACARTILSSLARRAYRRPVTDRDTLPLLKLFDIGRQGQAFEDGIAAGLRGLLVSPEFLFRVELDPTTADTATDAPRRISSLELASRLSFFLWSTIPDEGLLSLGEMGKLNDPLVLQREVRRMMEDRRSHALIEHFGGQWLLVRKLRTHVPDARIFPELDDNLRDAVCQEIDLFFESIVREDRSVLDLLTADHTFVNERLARHYEIPGVYGSHMRRITLTDDTRFGLLGKAGILMATSYSNRTAPTLRGQWVLDSLLGTPPPPPPPNVPALSEGQREGGRALSVRERLDAHRQDPVCAGCHARMDPIGLALDNFDAVGHWRTSEGGTPVDPSGGFPDGTKFRGPAELRKVLLNRSDQFVSTVVEKLLIYALGRGLTEHDAPAVRGIVRQAAASHYRWSSLVLGVVNSMPFLMTNSARATAASAAN